MAEPIEIIIRKGTGGEGTGFGVAGADGRENSDSSQKSSSVSLLKRTGVALGAFAVATTKKSINYSISQYGNMTGNYIKQAEIELTLQYLNNAISIGGAAVSGAAMGSIVPGIGTAVGAIVGAGIATANIALNYGFQWKTLQTNIIKLDTYSNIMKDRSGNSYNNGSRGTDY